ncbi:MAG TPA: sigma-54-dependent Fis family transcriptional regulator [Gammaproteobacteria bacterium]|nr:sigma-54-dependent Fis family transcriptional regulator [Gammaproteobacteria bacterium]
MTDKTILVVDDDTALRDVLNKTLSMENYNVITAEDGRHALSILKANKDIDLLLTDVEMKPMDGHTLLKKCKKQYPELPVILMTAYGSVENAVNAMHDGAADYLVKPFEYRALTEMIERFISPLDNTDSGLIAVDMKSVQLSQVAKKVASSEATVMITGESGVGKEVVSRFIHEHSIRAEGPFVAINCAAIPENMLEAVLFGYEKGAYTGASQSRAGKFEQAQGGTLLLDEITEMGLGLQAKLLRVLQEREVERLGGSKVIALDVRILATTNRDLHQEVIDGRFREDLFYRLNVFPLNILPLSERRDDILPIANKMLNAHSHTMTHIDTGRGGKICFSISAQRALKSHNWPGNIRELDNVIQRALILKTGSVIDDVDIQFEETTNYRQISAVPEIQDETTEAGLNGDLKAREQDLIISALSAKSSRKEVAEKLGISPRTLRYKLARMRDAGVALPA